MLLGLSFFKYSKFDLLKAFELELSENVTPKLVVTPNLDHLVKLERDVLFRRAYSSAEYVIADGWPIGVLGRVYGLNTGILWPGSSLVPDLFSYLNERGLVAKVYLLGSPPGVNEIAERVIGTKWPNIKVVGHCCPAVGFLNNIDDNLEICHDINRLSPHYIIIGLGAPTQELFFLKNYSSLKGGVFFGVGATVEFIAGTRQRAPFWVQKIRCEWLYRLLQEPRRLARRYLYCGVLFIRLFFSGLLKKIF